MIRLRALRLAWRHRPHPLAVWRRLPRETRGWEALADLCAWGMGVACAHLPPAPGEAERTERIKAGVMADIAADHGEGMARRQLAAGIMAEDLATGRKASRGGTRNGHGPKGND